MTMTLVSTITLSGSASNITFSSIPQTATDLYILLSGRSTNSDSSMSIRFNGLTTNLTLSRLTGYGLGGVDAGSSTAQVGNIVDNAYTANTFGSAELYVCNYAQSVTKTFHCDSITENNGNIAVQNFYHGLWNSTAAVTSIGLFGNFAQHSTASLYTITKA